MVPIAVNDENWKLLVSAQVVGLACIELFKQNTFHNNLIINS